MRRSVGPSTSCGIDRSPLRGSQTVTVRARHQEPRSSQPPMLQLQLHLPRPHRRHSVSRPTDQHSPPLPLHLPPAKSCIPYLPLSQLPQLTRRSRLAASRIRHTSCPRHAAMKNVTRAIASGSRWPSRHRLARIVSSHHTGISTGPAGWVGPAVVEEAVVVEAIIPAILERPKTAPDRVRRMTLPRLVVLAAAEEDSLAEAVVAMRIPCITTTCRSSWRDYNSSITWL